MESSEVESLAWPSVSYPWRRRRSPSSSVCCSIGSGSSVPYDGPDRTSIWGMATGPSVSRTGFDGRTQGEHGPSINSEIREDRSRIVGRHARDMVVAVRETQSKHRASSVTIGPAEFGAWTEGGVSLYKAAGYVRASQMDRPTATKKDAKQPRGDRRQIKPV